MDAVTIEALAVNPGKKLTDSTRKLLIQIIQDEFCSQTTMYDADIKERQLAIKEAYKKKVGWRELVKKADDAKHRWEQAQKAVQDTGLDFNENPIMNAYHSSELAVEKGRALQVQLDNVEKEVKSANNLKNKIIARMALADTAGEACVILRQSLGNGIIPSLTQKQLTQQ